MNGFTMQRVQLVLYVLGMAMILIPATASACSLPLPERPPPPFMGESSEAYQKRMAQRTEDARLERENRARISQVSAYDGAEQIFIAVIVKVRTKRVDWYLTTQKPIVTLRPIAWIKGPRAKRTFKLTYSGDTMCGPYGGGYAVTGQLGDTFVVFAGPDKNFQYGHFNIPVADALDPRLIAVLESEPVFSNPRSTPTTQ